MSESSTSSNDNRQPRRRSWLWIGLTVVVIVATASAALFLLQPNGVSTALAALQFLKPNGAQTASAADEPLHFAEVVIADLRQEEEFNGKLESVGGTGTLIPASQIDLAFSTPGTVVELPARVGQEVQAGDVLARLDATPLAAQLEIGVAQAEINLDVAQQALDALLSWAPDTGQIAQLEANLVAAQAAYDTAEGQKAATEAHIKVSEIGVAQAERQLAQAQAFYQTAWDPARDWELYAKGGALQAEREGATNALQAAQENLQIVQLNHAALVASSNSSGLANAQSQVLSAEQALAAAAEGPTDEQIAAAQTAIAQAQLNLQQAQLNLETHLAGTALIAPVAGTVMNVHGHLGGQGGTGPFITLADLSPPTLEVFFDETHLDKVAIGSQVRVAFSALPTEAFTGTVVQVDPQLIQSGDLSTMRVLVQLDSHHDQALPAGLTAAVNVVGLPSRIVRVFVPLADEGLLGVGDPVTVELPDLSQVPGTVVFVPQAPTASVSGPATFHVLVEIRGEGGLGDLADLADETSVDVIFVADSVEGVMAIPVSALLALLEGGYAVEVETGPGQTQLVAVEVGFFGSNNMIAVNSDRLQPGDRVVVP